MKNSPLIYFLIIGVVFGGIYVSRLFVSDHITLNKQAILPDGELLNVVYYLEREEPQRSAIHLNTAVEIIELIKQDVDLNTAERLDQSIAELESLGEDIVTNRATREQVDRSIANTLRNLAIAQFSIFELYAEVGKLKEAGKALDFAESHLTKASEFSDSTNQAALNILVDQLRDIQADESRSAVELITDIDEIAKQLK